MTDDRQGMEGAPSSGEGTDDNKLFGLRKLDLFRVIEGKSGVTGEVDTSSVTLVRTPKSTVVVDSGSKPRREELLTKLKNNGVIVEKINVLVTTGAHPLHTGNDSIFSHALQHVMRDEWTKTTERTGRKVAIKNRYHWIDRYLKLELLPFPGTGSLVLLFNVPKREEDLENDIKAYAGKVIGITGRAVPSEDDPEIMEALSKVRSRKDGPIMKSTDDISTLEELLSYCDYIIPAYGPMFRV